MTTPPSGVGSVLGAPVIEKYRRGRVGVRRGQARAQLRAPRGAGSGGAAAAGGFWGQGRGGAARTFGPRGVLPKSPPPRPWEGGGRVITQIPPPPLGKSTLRPYRTRGGEGHERERIAEEAKMSASPGARDRREGWGPRPASQ